MCANSEDLDQMPHSEGSDLGLRCLPMSHKKDARLIRVNNLLTKTLINEREIPFSILSSSLLLLQDY